MKNYRTGFLLTLIGNIAFAGVLAGFWWHSRAAKPAAKAESQQANSAAQVPGSGSTAASPADRKSTRLNSSHSQISYAVFCLKKKKKKTKVENRHVNLR